MARKQLKGETVFVGMSPQNRSAIAGQAGGAGRKTVFVGMSGGVDSSVAAALLKRDGYDVVGVHLRCYNVDGCAQQDAEDARRAAERLNIPFYVFDFEEAYKRRVVDYMVEGYRQGITPNPDVMCNRKIKFGLFLQKALELGADFVATGHYVRGVISAEAGILNRQTPYQLFEARDKNKDQSYFLWTLTQEQLRHCLFPIGDYLKTEVRALARKFKLPNAEKKDSQGICFLGAVTLADFLKEYIPVKPGLVMTAAGERVGEHNGAQFYTIGQRHGFSIKHLQKGAVIPAKAGILYREGPYYIAGKNIKNNTLVVTTGDDPALSRRELTLTNVNFIRPITIRHKPIAIYVRVRYRQPLAKATLQLINSRPPASSKLQRGEQAVTHQLKFDQSIKCVAPGQSAVFYSKQGEMLGGGIIASA